MRDAAGNYIFEYQNNKYTIMKMGWREQRDFIGIFRNVTDENDEIQPFTEEFNKAQDWLLPKIAHVTSGALQYLKDDYLESHLETFTISPVESSIGIFLSAVKELMTSFFPKGSNQNNLNQDAELSLEKTDYQTKLSKTLS